jgi:hypothetical protein
MDMVSQPTIDRAVPHQEIDRVVLQRQIKRVISRRQIKRALRFARPALAQELGEEAAAAVEGRLAGDPACLGISGWPPRYAHGQDGRVPGGWAGDMAPGAGTPTMVAGNP